MEGKKNLTMKNIDKINHLVGSIWEELEEDGLERYEPYTSATKPTKQWKLMSQKFEKVFELLQKEMNK